MSFLTAGLLLPAVLAAGPRDVTAAGTLRAHPNNPRFVADGSGKAIYLAGSHTWATIQERGVEGETADFDYPGYLDFMQGHGHNFLRLWAWEHAAWMQFAARGNKVRYKPLAYARTGPGEALDGGPKFDLTRLNQEYFDRLRARVVEAGRRGIYVSVMFFQGFSVEQKGTKGVDAKRGNPWDGHPFHKANNVNGVDGDLNGDGEGLEAHTLASPEITRLQEAYVRRVVDTFDDLDHVVWEIGNECHPGSVEWHYHLIRFVKEYEAGKPKQHLVGMTGSPLKNPEMFASPADWISPVGRNYLEDPPAADESKLVIVDTDHIAPEGTEPLWVWKNLLRGNHFVTMDYYKDYRAPADPMADWGPIRRAMGHAVRRANILDLGRMLPRGELASTGYCLADPGREYLALRPGEGALTLMLPAETRTYTVEWVEIGTGRDVPGGRRAAAGEASFTPPFAGPAALHLKAEDTAPRP